MLSAGQCNHKDGYHHAEELVKDIIQLNYKIFSRTYVQFLQALFVQLPS